MSGPQGTLRAFIALSVPPEAQRSLEPAVQHLSAVVPGAVRWVDLDGLHLTLKFLGNVESTRVDDIVQGMRRACRDLAPFELDLSELGVFPNASRPRVVWAGVQGDLGLLTTLQGGIETEMSALGFSPEKRPFAPHLTLGRVRDRAGDSQRRLLGGAVSGCSIDAARPWLVEAVYLVRSELGTGGATYTALASAPLGGGTS